VRKTILNRVTALVTILLAAAILGSALLRS